MAVETVTTLREETISRMQDLIQINISSYEGLLDAAGHTGDQRVAEVFRETARERSGFADELKMHVEWNGEKAEDSGGIAAKVHQLWMDMRAKLNGGDPHVVLIEAEYGEDHIKQAYEEALRENPGSAVSDLLHSQYKVIKRGHDRIRDLRDAYASK